MNIPKLSFCITCMNRLNQIKETLPQNLRDNILFNEKIEFIVVDLPRLVYSNGSKVNLKKNYVLVI